VKQDATSPIAGEHLIAYAYPSSPRASRLNRGRTGCYVVQTASGEVAVASFDEALQRVKPQGTAPQRWSMDHPLNARFLGGRERALVEAASPAIPAA